MIPADILLLYLLASAALALAPGPDNLYVLAQSALHGWQSGFYLTLGLCSGLLVHIAAVVLGVAVIISSSALAFNVLKIAGAGYLLLLAWQAFRAGSGGFSSAPAEMADEALVLYRRGILMNISNPKVAIFFLAFLPQFADPARGALWLQLVLLGLLFMLSALVIFNLLAWGAGRLGHWLRNSARARLLLQRLSGTVLLLLAARLLFSRQ